MKILYTLLSHIIPEPRASLKEEVWGKVEKDFVQSQHSLFVRWKKVFIGSAVVLCLGLLVSVHLVNQKIQQDSPTSIHSLDKDLNSLQYEVVEDPEMNQILQVDN
jgi:hypothetical protein